MRDIRAGINRDVAFSPGRRLTHNVSSSCSPLATNLPFLLGAGTFLPDILHLVSHKERRRCRVSQEVMPRPLWLHVLQRPTAKLVAVPRLLPPESASFLTGGSWSASPYSTAC